MSTSAPPDGRYLVDPTDPRAPSQEVWDAMSPEEQAAVLDALPSEFPALLYPPEGDWHFVPKVTVRDTLERYFRRRGAAVYLASELPVYYPHEPMFSPDLMAVRNVETHWRDHWVVSREGRGIDLALEIHHRGSLVKDLDRNVERLARLGVAEYFVWDVRRGVLYGFHLPEGGGAYEAVPPGRGRMYSTVLGLGLAVVGDKLRFFAGDVPVPEADELIQWLESSMEAVTDKHRAEARRADEAEERAALEAERAAAEAARATAEAARATTEAARATTEAERATTEAERAERAEQRLAEALAELARLRGEPG